jgi:hypothetical protein
MHLVHYSVLGPVLAALLAPAASPALAQTSEASSTRATLMEQARDELARESVAPEQRLFPHWKTSITVTIRNRNGLLDVVGIDRPTDLPKQERKQP